MRKINIILALVMVLTFLSACQTDQGKAYMERLGMESDQFTSFVIVLDYGCHACKDRFYEYVLEAFPEHSAVIFKRKPDQATLVNNKELFDKAFVFVDSLDISYEMGVTEKNTELALWKNGKVETFSFLEYEKLIKSLELDPTDVGN
mgnify:CR=1 FL=1